MGTRTRIWTAGFRSIDTIEMGLGARLFESLSSDYTGAVDLQAGGILNGV